MEFRNSGLEESYQLGVPCFGFFSSLLFFSPNLISSLDLGPVQMASALVLPHPDHSQMEVEVPRAPDPQKGYRTVPIGSVTFELVPVRTGHGCITLSFPFLVSYVVYAAEEVYA